MATPIEIGAFLATWTAMMAAMMLPSATPMILLHRLGASGASRLATELRSGVFVTGYLLVWAAVGIAALALMSAMDAALPAGTRTIATAVLLMLAGAYQFTPLQTTCLRACRSPADFLVTHWYSGATGTLRLGLAHGLYCLGCCWALMAVFVGVGAMDLRWAVIIALVVFVEKVLPRGVALGQAIGLALIAGAALVASGVIASA